RLLPCRVRCCYSLRMSTRGTAHRLRIGGMNAIPARNLYCLGLLCASLLAGAGFEISQWKFHTPVRVPESGRLVVIPFDRTLYSRMRQDLGDLRIVRDGEEIPYVIEKIGRAHV